MFLLSTDTLMEVVGALSDMGTILLLLWRANVRRNSSCFSRCFFNRSSLLRAAKEVVRSDDGGARSFEIITGDGGVSCLGAETVNFFAGLVATSLSEEERSG